MKMKKLNNINLMIHYNHIENLLKFVMLQLVYNNPPKNTMH
jgi:hypothetical protein